MKAFVWVGALAGPALLWGQSAVNLPEFVVNSPRVANQSAVGTFVMPITALRFEPQVDIQARNLAEGQADVTLRGGIFENTGFQVGSSTLVDPQTGHYFAEIPIAPAMLRPPQVITGAGTALGAANSTVGTIAYDWRPIRTQGAAWVAFGEHGLNREDIYQGLETPYHLGQAKLGTDLSFARSESNGPIAFGEHRFQRVNGRVQLAGRQAQTDVFAGYQTKFFGWPNLYTPFNSAETEDLETLLFAFNHRRDLGDGDFAAAGAYFRRNKDDYAFNRFAPVGPVHPFQHTTWVRGGAFSLRRTMGEFVLNERAEILADELHSTSLTFGHYYTRTLAKFALVPEKSWSMADGGKIVVQAGASYDDSNRDGGSVSPVFEMAREFGAGAVRRIYASYVRTTQLPTYTALNSSPTAGLFRGNPNLGREVSQGVEVGFSGDVANWATQAAVFWRADDALVDWTFLRGVTARTANPVDMDVGGFEFVARRSWSMGEIVLGYTYLNKDADYRGAAVDASFYALNYARHRLTAALTLRLGHGFELRVDNVARVQAANLLRVTGGDDAITTSLGLAYHPEGFPGLEVSVQADNLWDNDFQEVPSVPAAPRQLSAGVAYHW